MKNTLYNIILLRHAESVKNIKKIHGGQGEELTEKGIKQCHAISNFFKEQLDLSQLRIFASTSFHTRATASVICEDLSLPLEKPFAFKPLYLGIADGLSEQQLKELNPHVSDLFVAWRKKEIDIKKLIVPDMEHYMDFWNRGSELIANLPKDASSVLVCSNSLFILLANFLMGNHPEITDKYRHINIHNCGLFTVSTSDFVHFKIVPSLTNIENYGTAPLLIDNL